MYEEALFFFFFDKSRKTMSPYVALTGGVTILERGHTLAAAATENATRRFQWKRRRPAVAASVQGRYFPRAKIYITAQFYPEKNLFLGERSVLFLFLIFKQSKINEFESP